MAVGYTHVYANAEGTEYATFEEVRAAFMSGRTIIIVNGEILERVLTIDDAYGVFNTTSANDYRCATAE